MQSLRIVHQGANNRLAITVGQLLPMKSCWLKRKYVLIVLLTVTVLDRSEK
jgi:hypothetical protein